MLPVRGGGNLGSLGILGVCTACQALAGNWVHIAAPVCGSAACLETVDADEVRKLSVPVSVWVQHGNADGRVCR